MFVEVWEVEEMSVVDSADRLKTSICEWTMREVRKGWEIWGK